MANTRRSVSPPADRHAAPTAPRGPCAEIAALARDTTTLPEFLSGVVRCIGRGFASPYAAVYARLAAEVVQDDCHFGSTDPAFWKPGLQQFLTESLSESQPRAKLLQAKGSDAQVAFLCAPLRGPAGQTLGAIAVVAAPIAAGEVVGRLAELEAQAALASHLTGFVGRRPESVPAGATSESPGARLDGRLAAAGRFGSAEELAFALTNDLSNRSGCEQVSLGIAEGNHVRILSISGLDQVNRKSPGTASIRNAMEECLDAGATISCPPPDPWEKNASVPVPRYRLHKQWRMATNGDAVASVPLRWGEQVAAVLGVRTRGDRVLATEQLDKIRDQVEPFVPVLILARKAGRSLFSHATDRARALAAVVTQRESHGPKVLAGCGVLMLVGFLFGSAQYNITVPCVVTPADVRHLQAPFDGVLASASATAGDRVQAGDMLCALDTREYERQRAGLLAEIAVQEREVDQARAADVPVEVQLALSRLQLARARLDIVAGRIERAAVRAPFDGVVVAGDLRPFVGSVVAKGDALFEIAPLGRWTIELEVGESLAADIAVGQTGLFSSRARPEERYPLRVSRIHGRAETRGNRNVIVAEADISAAGAWMRPGVEGGARIVVGRRRIWWLTLHRAIDYLRVNFWI